MVGFVSQGKMKVDSEMAIRTPGFVRMIGSIRLCRSGCCTIFAETKNTGYDIFRFYTLVSLFHAQANLCMGLPFDISIVAWIFTQSLMKGYLRVANAWHGGLTLKMISSSKEICHLAPLLR